MIIVILIRRRRRRKIPSARRRDLLLRFHFLVHVLHRLRELLVEVVLGGGRGRMNVSMANQPAPWLPGSLAPWDIRRGGGGPDGPPPPQRSSSSPANGRAGFIARNV